MPSVELTPEWPAGLRRPPTGLSWQTPRSYAVKPAAFAPYPPLVSGGWYRSVDQEVLGPGRYPVAAPVKKSAVTAVLLTLLFGPLGLCYLSAIGGLVATAVTVVVAMAWTVPTLAIIWPVAMGLAILSVRRQQSGRGDRATGSAALRSAPDPANRTWFLTNV
jgi:hypothetical protein